MSDMRLETITPTLAQRYLDTQAPNRTIKPGGLASMIDVLNSGKWNQDVSSIKFDSLDRLIDGQHRLAAVVKTGRSITVWVHRGVDPEVQKYIDTGIKRSAADVLTIMGVKYPSHVASGARLVMAHEAGQAASGDSYRVTPAQVAEWWGEHPSIVDSVPFAERLYREHGVYKSVGMALHYLLVGASDDVLAAAFFDGLSTRTGLGAGSALLALDRALSVESRASGAGHRTAPERYMALAIKGWNAWVAGRTVKSLRWAANEEFPEVLHPKLVHDA